jgi:hypothetical protein
LSEVSQTIGVFFAVEGTAANHVIRLEGSVARPTMAFSREGGDVIGERNRSTT